MAKLPLIIVTLCLSPVVIRSVSFLSHISPFLCSLFLPSESQCRCLSRPLGHWLHEHRHTDYAPLWCRETSLKDTGGNGLADAGCATRKNMFIDMGTAAMLNGERRLPSWAATSGRYVALRLVL
ncbi:hypothetical protein TSUD_50980 [Trifolium subterraneum]|uniref:Secreted protein n=1 Tax=Trifolium subterraneum TaxID=3900 RepID=A0A2Z6LJU0_TRISU|nr:hypothetical protein TSUD_50980 [Trifolium subterraneum]